MLDQFLLLLTEKQLCFPSFLVKIATCLSEIVCQGYISLSTARYGYFHLFYTNVDTTFNHLKKFLVGVVLLFSERLGDLSDDACEVVLRKGL